jgi:DNA-3-methyladenine glycosylase II
MEQIGVPPRPERAAIARLVRADPDLARVEREAGPLPWRVRDGGFPGLLHTIVGQQISTHAARAIWQRLCALQGCLTPAGLLALSEDALRTAGLSRQKIAYVRSLATEFAEGRLSDDRIAALDDESAVAAISAVRGLGAWSAEIYLLFVLQRRDVFPAADLALAAAAADLKRLDARPSPRALRELAAAWQPWRGLAARLLWHWYHHLHQRPRD